MLSIYCGTYDSTYGNTYVTYVLYLQYEYTVQ